MAEYRLGIYEKALPANISWEEKLTASKNAGFDWLEISVDETCEKLARLEWSRDEISAVIQAQEKTVCPIRTMCLSGHRKYPLGSRDEEKRSKALSIMEKAINLALALGVRIIQLAGYDVYYEAGDDETRALFRENLCRAVEMAARNGVVLGFETMETAFMDTVEKSMAYVRAIASPWLGVYPDLGNLTNAALIYGTPATVVASSLLTQSPVTSDLQTGAGHIFACHLKETTPGVYRDMDFGTGHTDYESGIAVLWSQGVRMFTAECWYHGEADWAIKLSQINDFLREKIAIGSLKAKSNIKEAQT